MTAGELAEAYLGALGRAHGSTASGTPPVTIWFRFDWQLPSGQRAPFDVLDVLEPAADDRIAALHIVYATADVRPVFENETRRPSWHPGRAGH